MADDTQQDPNISGTGNIALQTGRPAGSLTGFITSMVNIHAARQQQAGGQLDRMLKAAGAGFPIDPKAVEKTAKKAGLPLMHPDDMKGLLEGTGKPAGAPPEGSEQQAADPHAAAYNVKSITDVKERQKKETELGIDGIIRNSVMNAHLQGQNQTAVLQHTQKLMELKNAALGGNAEALGRLYQLGEVKGVDVSAEVYNGFTPEQKAQYGNVMLGYETPQQKAQREQGAAMQQVSEGRFDNLADATKYVQAVSSGGPIPPELAAKANAHPLSDMVKGLDAMDVLAKMGYSGDALVSAAGKFGLIGLASLPTGTQTIYQREMKVKEIEAAAARTEAGAAASNAATKGKEVEGFNRVGADGKQEHVQGSLEQGMSGQEIQKAEQRVQMAKIEAVMKSSDDKLFLQGFTQNMLAFRAGRITAETMESWTDQLVKRDGGVVSKEEIKRWWGNPMRLFKGDVEGTQSNYSWPEDQQPSPDDNSGAPGAP